MSNPLSPMLLANGDGGMPRNPEDWVMEPKFDGWRFLVHIDENKKVTAYTRSGNTDYRLWGIEEDLPRIFPPDTIVDMEVVVDGYPLKQSTDVVMVITTPASGRLIGFVFDVVRMAGKDVRWLPWNQRRWLIEKAIPEAPSGSRFHGQVGVTPVYDPEVDILEGWLKLGFEGAVLKRKNSRYESGGRNGNWIKIKPQQTADFKIVGFAPGGGKFEGMVGAVQFEVAPGQVGQASGMTDAVRLDMTHNPDKYVGKLAEFAYHGMTTGGFPRHPQWRRLRDDL